MPRRLVASAAAVLALLTAAGCGATHHAASTTVGSPGRTATAAHVMTPAAPDWHVRATLTGHLAAPLQDAAPASSGGAVTLLGGLTAADTSSSAVLRATATGAQTVATLPGALHDAAGGALGRSVYLFGGGNGVAQLDQILRVTGSTVSQVGKLPAPSSDQTGAVLGSAAYVVGGYTGTAWLDTIVAFQPARGARVVAHLPTAVRYAAVTSTDGELVIAGGSLPNGTASRTVYGWKPGWPRARPIGHLPAATTHATAATIGTVAYVIGGRGASLDTPTNRIVAVDPRARSVRLAGHLPVAVSDASAAASGARILVFGGHTTQATTDGIVAIAQRTSAPARKVARAALRTPKALSSTNVYAADVPNALRGAARTARDLVYVPNSLSNTVDVIDPHTYKVIDHFAVGALPQHVMPAWDLKTLYVLNDKGNSLTADQPGDRQADAPRSRSTTRTTCTSRPTGSYAIVVAERLHRLDFRDPHTFALHHSLTVPCSGVDHMDFSADGRYLIAAASSPASC